jgi:predicted nucleotidyltransferase
MLDKAEAYAVAEKFAEKAKEILNPKAVLIFGSYVNGIPHEYSDIDIAVIVNDFKGDWLETGAMLCGISREISFDIEPHLLDESRDRSGFVEHIMKTGVYIYKAA